MINHQLLESALSQANWKQADQITAQFMLEIMGQVGKGYLTDEQIRQFPCDELNQLDQLWLKYSNGHFGFSVQKRIWVKLGGTPNVFNREIYNRFGEEVKWRFYQKWIPYPARYYSASAPLGHLPSKYCVIGWFGGYVIAAMSGRIAQCDL